MSRKVHERVLLGYGSNTAISSSQTWRAELLDSEFNQNLISRSITRIEIEFKNDHFRKSRFRILSGRELFKFEGARIRGANRFITNEVAEKRFCAGFCLAKLIPNSFQSPCFPDPCGDDERHNPSLGEIKMTGSSL